MSKKRKGTPYIDYFISIHYGICQGPVDELVNLICKDKSVFDEGQTYTSEANFEIYKPDLFGGPLREGGMVGQMHWLPGKIDQECPWPLADRMSGTPETLPGFRELATLFTYGNHASGSRGFEIGSNSPSVPALWARVRRASRQLGSNSPIIQIGNWMHSNAANMLYEIVTDPVWGMNGSPNMVDTANFRAVAATLAEENFGLTLKWTQEGSIEDFAQIILDHINGCMYFNPYIGKLQLKLFRNDYDPNLLREIGPDNAQLVTFRRPLLGETINEIVLTWFNPDTLEEATVTYQDLANIAMQGQVVSDTRDYPGIRNEDLANTVCARELASSTAPLASATIKVDRNENPSDPLLPGSVFKFTWPLPGYDIDTVIMRVIDIDWGTPENSIITLKCVEDIYGAPLAIYLKPEPPAWEPPGKDPDDPIFENMALFYRSMPYSLIAPYAEDGDVQLSDDLYNQIVIGTFLLPTKEQPDVVSYELYRPALNSAGEPSEEYLGERWPTGHAVLLEPLQEAVTSEIELPETVGGPWPQEGTIGLITPEDLEKNAEYPYDPAYPEHYEELVLFQTYLGNNRWRIIRGILDTVPHNWKKDDRIIFITDNYNGYDFSERFADTEELYNFRLRTSKGVSEKLFDGSTIRVDRPYRPYRPANVRVGVTAFGTEDQSQNTQGDGNFYNDQHIPREWYINVSWSNRNRMAEDSVYLRWDAGDVAPEIDQTTEIVVLAPGGAEVARVVGLTGTSYSMPIVATTADLETLIVKVISKRGEFESLQGVEIKLKLYIKGFGSDWGYLYGGWPESDIMTRLEIEADGPFADFAAEGDTDG